MTKAGCIVKFWIRDWFAQLNDKMGGDLKKIQIVGRYMIEIWKVVGMDMDNVEFLWTSEETNKRTNERAGEYWPLVMDIARRNNLPRIKRCSQLMAHSDEDDLTPAQILYVCMQCADILFLKANYFQLDLDQEEAFVLAEEYCNETKRDLKSFLLPYNMLPGLQNEVKMSKSISDSPIIFMEDEESEVKAKINKAFCPPQQVDGNPIIEYTTYIALPYFGEFVVTHHSNNGVTTVYKTTEQLQQDYMDGVLHPDENISYHRRFVSCCVRGMSLLLKRLVQWSPGMFKGLRGS